MTIRTFGALLGGAAFVFITTTGALALTNNRVNYTVTATGRIGHGIKKNPNYNGAAQSKSKTNDRMGGGGGSGQSAAGLQIKNIPTGPGDDIKINRTKGASPAARGGGGRGRVGIATGPLLSQKKKN
jgi:hypothetical protein